MEVRNNFLPGKHETLMAIEFYKFFKFYSFICLLSFLNICVPIENYKKVSFLKNNSFPLWNENKRSA